MQISIDGSPIIFSILQVPTVLDYIRVLSKLASCTDKERYLSEYICELCLQHVDLTVHKQSYLAASCIILAKVMLKEGM